MDRGSKRGHGCQAQISALLGYIAPTPHSPWQWPSFLLTSRGTTVPNPGELLLFCVSYLCSPREISSNMGVISLFVYHNA